MQTAEAVAKKTPLAVVKTDRRIFLLTYKTDRLFSESVSMEFTQLDFLQMSTYLKRNNQRLYDKIMRFVGKIDEVTGEKTDMARKIPRRRTNGELH